MIRRLLDWKTRFDLGHTRAWYTGWALAGPAIAGLITGLVLVLVVLR